MNLVLGQSCKYETNDYDESIGPLRIKSTLFQMNDHEYWMSKYVL